MTNGFLAKSRAQLGWLINRKSSPEAGVVAESGTFKGETGKTV